MNLFSFSISLGDLSSSPKYIFTTLLSYQSFFNHESGGKVKIFGLNSKSLFIDNIIHELQMYLEQEHILLSCLPDKLRMYLFYKNN